MAYLWAHSSVLNRHPHLAAIISKLHKDDGKALPYKMITTEFPIQCYCSLVQFLYTGDITLKIDLLAFSISIVNKAAYSFGSLLLP